MSAERVRDFYEMATADEKVRRELEQAISAACEEAKLSVIANYAKQAGYEVTAEEVENYIRSSYEKARESSNANAKLIRDLDPEEMEKIAGGAQYCDKKGYCNKTEICWNAGHIFLCHDTTQNDDNCFWSDKCNHLIESYEL